MTPDPIRPEEHLRLARHVLIRLDHRPDEDKMAAAVVALVEAARDWNSPRRPQGVVWATFAANRIRWARLGAWRSGAAKAKRLEVPLFLLVDDDDEAEVERPEAAQEDPGPAQAAARVDVEKLLGTLTAKEADVIRRRFGIGTEPATFDQIGEDLGVGKERVRQIERGALGRLRKRAGRGRANVYDSR